MAVVAIPPTIFGMAVVRSTSVFTAPATITVPAATDIGLIIKLAASPTANALEVRSSADAVLASIGPTGSLSAGGGITLVGNGSFDAVATNIGIVQIATRQLGIRIGSDGHLFEFNGNKIGLASGVSLAWSSSADLTTPTYDTFLSRKAAATLHLGAADAASPVAQTLGAQGARAGTDTNVGGANTTVRASIGTGTGAISTLALQSPVAVASGTGAQTSTTGLLIRAGAAVLTSYTVAALPAAATAGAGATAFVTDASTTLTLGIGTAVVGGGANKLPVHSDGTSWIIG